MTNLMDLFNNPEHDKKEDGYLLHLGGGKRVYRLTCNHSSSSYGFPVIKDLEGISYGQEDKLKVDGFNEKLTGKELVEKSINEERKINGKPLFSYKWQAEMVAKFLGNNLDNYKWQLDENNNYVEG